MSKLLYCPIAKLLFSVTGLPYGCFAKLPFLTVICGLQPMPREKDKFCNENNNAPLSIPFPNPLLISLRDSGRLKPSWANLEKTI